MKTKLFPHDDDFRRIADGIWQITGSLDYPLKRNMTVVRLPDKSLLLYSVIALSDSALVKLEKLGTPTVIVVPSKNHTMDLPFYRARYPKAKVVSYDAASPVRGIRPDGSAMEVLSTGFVVAKKIPGFKMDEIYLEIGDKGEHSLCVCDALAGENGYKPGFMAALAKSIMGVKGGKFGVARIVKLAYLKDRVLFKKWLREIAQTPALARILVAHGDALTTAIPENLAEIQNTL